MRHFVTAAMLLLTSAAEASWDELQLAVYGGIGTVYSKTMIHGVDDGINGQPMLLLMADIDYKDFFLESLQRGKVTALSSATVGYRLWSDEQMSLAIVGSNYNGQVTASFRTLSGYHQIPQLAGIADRKADYPLGLRLDGVHGEHYWSLEVAKDLEYHHGTQSRFFYSYRQMLLNWDLYYNLGWLYADRKVVDYYLGVRPQEVTLQRPAYRGRDGYQLQAGLSAVLPLSEQWLFEAGISVTEYSRAYSDSPLASGKLEHLVLVGARYVF